MGWSAGFLGHLPYNRRADMQSYRPSLGPRARRLGIDRRGWIWETQRDRLFAGRTDGVCS